MAPSWTKRLQTCTRPGVLKLGCAQDFQDATVKLLGRCYLQVYKSLVIFRDSMPCKPWEEEGNAPVAKKCATHLAKIDWQWRGRPSWLGMWSYWCWTREISCLPERKGCWPTAKPRKWNDKAEYTCVKFWVTGERAEMENIELEFSNVHAIGCRPASWRRLPATSSCRLILQSGSGFANLPRKRLKFWCRCIVVLCNTGAIAVPASESSEVRILFSWIKSASIPPPVTTSIAVNFWNTTRLLRVRMRWKLPSLYRLRNHLEYQTYEKPFHVSGICQVYVSNMISESLQSYV